MNEIIKKPLHTIGYNFISDPYIPRGSDEYYLRNTQNHNGISYRNLTAYEIEVLVRNNNTSDDWNKIHVSDAFNPELVKNCKFYGLVRIGKLESISLEYHNVCLPVGLYNSTIISCDFGDNVVISNVNYISHYVIGSEVMIVNVHELHVTNHAKFGNGIIKDGEDEAVRIWVEVCNENAGRKIMPFDGMLAADAWLWSKYRDDKKLMQRFAEFTAGKFDSRRGYYGNIGDRTIIKNTSIIKDVWVGSDAYIKGANKLKNLTINSSPEAPSQIGEGCELVNGIIGNGCRIFYGVKAVRFIMASHSQLKYGARLINSYLGDNSTISCCEVLNSLIYPAHEQHHNNSFLCAAVVMGQSNIAAGATIGSNHNSRAADGEILAARGFWPGLCVSLKHNCRFASFTLLAKGDYQYELDIPLPFSLVSNDESANRLLVMPGYWFMYNLYALARNSGKYAERDKRIEKFPLIEYDFLAPDSINEMFTALDLLRKFTALAKDPSLKDQDESILLKAGEHLLADAANEIENLDILAAGFENSSRQVVICKVRESYDIFRRLIRYYGMTQLLLTLEENGHTTPDLLLNEMPESLSRKAWINLGGQLLPEEEFENMLDGIRNGSIQGWDDLHEFYHVQSDKYKRQKFLHAFASFLEVTGLSRQDFTQKVFLEFLNEALETRKWMTDLIRQSRAKDYQVAFRRMLYDNDEEMNEVLGSLDDNVFIKQQEAALEQMRRSVSLLSGRKIPGKEKIQA